MPGSIVGDVVDSFRFLLREGGWREAVVQSLQFLVLPVFEYRRWIVVHGHLTGLQPMLSADMPLTMKVATLDDLPLLETVMPRLRLRRIAKKIRQGELCALAIHQERAIGWVLIAFAGDPEVEELKLKLGPKEAYLYAGYFSPKYRGQGGFRFLHRYVENLLWERGYDSILAVTGTGNKVIRTMAKKRDYPSTDELTYLRILGWKWSRTKRLAI